MTQDPMNTCPDAETLAAFVDGRLTAQTRPPIVDHLDRCPACRSTVTEAAGVVAELSGAGVAEWRPLRKVATAAAAIAALALLAVLALDFGRGEQGLEEMLAAAAGAPVGLAETAPPTSAGLSFGGGVSPPRAAFRTGIWLVRLERSRVLDDTGETGRSAGEVARWLAAAGGPAELIEEHRRVEREPSAAASDLARRTARSLETPLLEQRVHFGAWAQAARVACSAGDREFFTAETIARHRAALDPDLDPPGAFAALDEIERLVVGAAPADLDRILRRLDDLLGMI